MRRARGATMRIKVYGGTARTDGASLCDSCRHARIIRGTSADEELVFCEASHGGSTRITFKVTSCTHHNDQGYLTYFELMQQAWIFRPGSRRKRPGFVRPSAFRDAEFMG